MQHEPLKDSAVSFDIMTTLKEGTAEEHRRVERNLDHCTSPDVTLADYTGLLERMYGFYAVWEPDMEKALNGRLGFYPERAKLQMLEDDLQRLGHTAKTINHLPRADLYPVSTALPSCLGALYVIEGSTLGGMLLSAHFNKVLGITPAEGGRFFAGYGRQTAAKWKVFGATLRRCIDEQNADAAVSSARDMFTIMDSWLSSQTGSAL